ncbi:MAG TPA: hypothetical protein VN181_08980 [Thermoanaerobaculia bacterium]|nr:hypothetical protein [Thermoanaerobaculia bacterium]
MAEAFAVTGYVPDAVAQQLGKDGWVSSGSVVEVRPDREVQDVYVRISSDAVQKVKVGASRGGTTLVQIILQGNANIESVIRHKATAEGLTRFYDPTLARVAAAAIANVIEA